MMFLCLFFLTQTRKNWYDFIVTVQLSQPTGWTSRSIYAKVKISKAFVTSVSIYLQEPNCRGGNI